MDIVNILILVVFISFAIYSIYELIIVSDSIKCTKENPCSVDLKNEARRSLFYILAIATFAYAYISSSEVETYKTRSIRYLDWVITTPIITYSYYQIGRINGVNVSFLNLLVTNLLFVGLGIIAEYFYINNDTYKALIFTFFSFFFLAIFLGNIYRLTKCLKKKGVNVCGLDAFFYIGWTLYGIIFFGEVVGFLNRDLVIGSYTILDFFTKIVYSAVANQVINS